MLLIMNRNKDLKNLRSLPLLIGDRVCLRLATETDLPEIINFYKINSQHFERVSSPKPVSFYTPEFWREKVKVSQAEFEGDRSCNLFIFDRTDNKTIFGFTNFFAFIRGAFHACILGYGLAESRQNRGLMTESLRLGINYLFDELNFHRIMANYSPNNQRSARVLRRLDFVIEGYAQNYLLVNGEWQAHVLTALTNHDWNDKI
jgi:ribosomal-protein-alanine N-acetyltransferase